MTYMEVIIIKMKINRIVPNCMTQELGVASEIYIAGCKHYCKGCYEPDLWDFDLGMDMNVDDIVFTANRFNPDTYVLLGGDPLFSPHGTLDLVQRLRKEQKPIWLLTGFTREQIKADSLKETIFSLCDAVKTGKYDATKKQKGFPASSNQRIWRNTRWESY